jgi:hypothetical protein
VFRVYLFDRSGGVFPHEVLHHHHVARLRDGEVWLGGDDQTEGLQLSGCVQFSFPAVIQEDFADVGQILMAELRGRAELFHVRVVDPLRWL